MKILVITIVLLITACSTPVKIPFPAAEYELMQKPKALNPIKLEDRDHVSLSEMLNEVVNNYRNCNENTVKYVAWQQWYKMMKQEYERAGVAK